MNDSLRRLWRLTRKELSECLRDRRTMLTLVLMPLLLYPVLAMAFLQVSAYQGIKDEWPKFYVGLAGRQVKGEERLELTPMSEGIYRYLMLGESERLQRHTGDGKPIDRTSPPKYLANYPRLEPVPTLDVEKAVRDGAVDVGVIPETRGGSHANSVALYRVDSTKGHDAVRYLELLTADANAWEVNGVFRRLRVQARGDPVRLRAAAIQDVPPASNSFLPILVPLVLILMTMTGAVYPAIDLTAGERERGTLEILVAAPIPRLSVLLAKYFAVLTVAMLTALVNLGMMAVTLLATGAGAAIFGDSLTPLALVQVLGLLVLFAAFFSAVLLSLTSFARSFKEAQSYLVPLMLLCLAPGILSLMDFPLGGPLAVAPLINIVLLARDILAGKADALLTGLVVVTTLLYALAAILFASRVFGAEAVLSSESSGWGEMMRRPSESKPRAESSTAMLCLAVLFPVYFLVNASVGQLREYGPAERLMLGSVINVALFAGMPLLAAWRGRVAIQPGFGLRAPSLLALVAAALLGVSLWPFVHEAVLQLKQFGLASLPESVLEAIKKQVSEWRTVSPALIVLSLAVVPAVVEEMFFRGYLLQALLGDGERKWRAIVSSAVLFALFHLFVAGAIAVERFLPSFLLGVLLAALAVRSGSVVPGMLLHLLYNASQVLLGYYEPVLIERGWLAAEALHYPAWLLASAGGAAATGFAVLAMSRRRAA